MAGRKGGSGKQNVSVDTLLKEHAAQHEVSSEETLAFAASAAVVSALPVYIFLAVKGLDLSGNVVVFAVIFGFTAVALFFSYLSSSAGQRGHLEQARRTKASLNSATAAKTKQERKELQQAREDRERASVAKEAAARAIGTNNILFLAIFLVLASILPFPNLYNYILSDGAAAGALILLTQRKK